MNEKENEPVTYDMMQVTAPVNKQNRTPGDPCHTLAKGNAQAAAVVYENHGQDSRIKEVKTAPQLNAKAGTGGGNLPLVQESAIGPGVDIFNLKQTGEIACTLSADGGMNGTGPKCFTQNQCGDVLTGDIAPSMGTNCNATGRNTAKVNYGATIRRLTPTECERLQGFPDGYTAIPYKGKPADKCPDGPRYKALGNSWAVPCARWIGERIAAVEARLNLPQEDLW